MLRVVVAVSLILIIGAFAWIVKIDKNLSILSSDIENLNKMTDQADVAETGGSQGSKSENGVCTTECLENIDTKIASALATISAQTKVTSPSTTTPSKQTSFVSLGSTYATFSTAWVDVPDSGVYIDLENDFGKDAKVAWEVTLKVAHGNGKAFARLFDDTNKIAVDFSELSTENNVSYKTVTSGNLPFWRGRNYYKVQIKSLNSFEITYSNGKIKISY